MLHRWQDEAVRAGRTITRIAVALVREAGAIASQAVLIAIGIDWDGRRQILAVELANRESSDHLNSRHPTVSNTGASTVACTDACTQH